MVDASTLITAYEAGHETAGGKARGATGYFPLATERSSRMSTRQQLEAEWQKASGYQTQPCPHCDGKNLYEVCEYCLDSRLVLATHKVPLDRKRILSWGVFWFVLATFFVWVLVNQ